MLAKISQIKKSRKMNHKMTLELIKNKDILFDLGQKKLPQQILCGFAMETSDLIEHAQDKLKKKNCDMIVANHLKTDGAGFQGGYKYCNIYNSR